MKEYYNSIFKRKSVRKYDETLHLTEADLLRVMEQTERLVPLDSGIRVKYEIVERSKTNAKRGEYCLLFYSEKKPGYLLNTGYMLQQLDLWLAAENIGACWYGMAKPESRELDGLSYVIMFSLGRSLPGDYRTGADDFTRKNIDEIWDGAFDLEVKSAVRLSPSACNTQSWRIISTADSLTVYRNPRVNSIIPKNLLLYFNSIDLGICLCHLECALEERGYEFGRNMLSNELEGELIPIARYTVRRL